MTSGRDDDALSWAGDSDPTLSSGGGHAEDPGGARSGEPDAAPAQGEHPHRAEAPDEHPHRPELPEAPDEHPHRPELPEGWSIAGPQSAVVAATGKDTRTTGTVGTGETAETSPETGSFALVAMGILAGIYLLYTIGWFIGIARVGNPVTDPVGEFMFSLGAWLAVAAPVIWFGAAYWLTSRPRTRILWLLLGVVVLAPLPFIFGSGLTA